MRYRLIIINSIDLAVIRSDNLGFWSRIKCTTRELGARHYRVS